MDKVRKFRGKNRWRKGGLDKAIKISEVATEDRERRAAAPKTPNHIILGDPPPDYRAQERMLREIMDAPSINPTLGIQTTTRTIAKHINAGNGGWYAAVSLPRISICEAHPP